MGAEKKGVKTFATIIGNVVDFGKDMWIAVKPVWDAIRGITEIVDNTLGRIHDAFDLVHAWMGEQFGTIFDWITEQTGLELDFIQDWTTDVFESYIDQAEDLLFDQLDPVLEWKVIVDDWLDRFRNLIDVEEGRTLREWLGAVNEFLPDGLPSFLVEARNWIQDFIENLPDGVRALVSDLAAAFDRAEGADVKVTSIIREPGVLDLGGVTAGAIYENRLPALELYEYPFPPPPEEFEPELDLDGVYEEAVTLLDEYDKNELHEYSQAVIGAAWEIEAAG